MADHNDNQRLLAAHHIEANEEGIEGNFIPPHEDNVENGDGDIEGNPEAELNGWLNIRECLQKEKIIGILSCSAFGGTTSAFLSSSLALLSFHRGHPPAISFIIPILGWTGIGSGAHLALRNKTRFCLYMWPISLFVAFSLMRFGPANISTSIALLFLLATANFFGCSLCACLLMHAEHVLPSLGPLLMYRHIPTLSIMISSIAGYYYNVFKSLEDLFSNSVRNYCPQILSAPNVVSDVVSFRTELFIQFKTNFEAQLQLSTTTLYSEEIMGVSGDGAVGAFVPLSSV